MADIHYDTYWGKKRAVYVLDEQSQYIGALLVSIVTL